MLRSVRSVSRILGAPQVHLSKDAHCECHLHSPDVDCILLPLSMATAVSVSHKGKSYVIKVGLANTVSSFQAQLEELTSVPVENQKLLFKGKKASVNDDDTLGVFWLKGGTKIQMLGSTVEEIGGLVAVEDEKKRTEQILRNRETQTKVRQDRKSVV